MEKNDLRTRVIRFRSKNKISQARFAKECGIAPGTVLKIENGGHIRRVTEIKILDFLEENNG